MFILCTWIINFLDYCTFIADQCYTKYLYVFFTRVYHYIIILLLNNSVIVLSGELQVRALSALLSSLTFEISLSAPDHLRSLSQAEPRASEACKNFSDHFRTDNKHRWFFFSRNHDTVKSIVLRIK